MSFHFITHNLIFELIVPLSLYVWTNWVVVHRHPGENVMSTAPLEIYLRRKLVTCSILILPAAYIYIYIFCLTIHCRMGKLNPETTDKNKSNCSLVCAHLMLEI